jgi:glutathione synthase/RimK-type ligase-like ATP-grasp enzyme
LLTAEALQRHVGKVRSAPCQFQEYVEKKHELRVTIIGDRIFAAEIDSQAQERTRFDWRHYDVPMRLRAGQLPSDVAERCFAFVRSYGLNFGAIDLIHTPDGRYVFLENNPNGQWLFVEDGVPEFKMTHALADCLARGEN